MRRDLSAASAAPSCSANAIDEPAAFCRKDLDIELAEERQPEQAADADSFTACTPARLDLVLASTSFHGDGAFSRRAG
jgi:hypothetical protein